MKIASLIPAVSTVILLLLAPVATGAQPTLEGAVVFGGPGDQYAHGVTAGGGGIYAVGWDAAVVEGIYLELPLPLSGPDWSQYMGYLRGPGDVALLSSDAYVAGWAYPPYCGASDGAGDTEGKPALYLYDDAGNFFGCGSTNFFPYRGGEYYQASLAAPDNSVYAAGRGEEMGWGGGRTILARYASDGTLLWKRRYATDLSGNHLGGTYTRIGSMTLDLAWLDGYLYLAGLDREATHIGGPPQQAMLLKVDAPSEPADPSPGGYATNLYPLWSRLAGVGSTFRGVAAHDGHIYAVGSSYIPGDCDSEDLLVEKYDPAGNLIWRSNPAASGAAGLWGIVPVGDRLYAVGSEDDSCDGDADALVAEIDPDGSISSSILWGGGLYDRAIRATASGDRLVVLGETRSFTEDGNAPGQLDLFLLELSVAPPDADGDGVLDDDDACPETAAGDVVASDGCSIAQLCPCVQPEGADPWKNHGAYVSCVAGASELFLELGLITGDEKDDIVSHSAQSSCGKKQK